MSVILLTVACEHSIVVENISNEVGYVNPLLRGFCFFSGTLRPQRRSTPLLEHHGSSASTRSLARSLSSYGVPTKHLFLVPRAATAGEHRVGLGTGPSLRSRHTLPTLRSRSGHHRLRRGRRH